MVTLDPLAVLVLAAVVGLMFGSFLNVLILRTHKGTSPWKGRSVCMHCHHPIRWFDNIPLVSFIVLRGQCRHCQAKLSWQYPLVEVGTAVVFAIVAHRFGATWWTLGAFAVTMMMIAVAVYDARWSLLPDSFSIVLAVFGFTFAALAKMPLVDLGLGLLAGASFFALQFFLSRGRWVGSGDILLGGAIGALLGWRMLGLALFIAYMVGAIFASVLLILRRQKTSSAISFGPFLVLGAFLSWLWGQQIVDWYFNHALFR